MTTRPEWRIERAAPEYPRPLLDLTRGQRPTIHGVGDRELALAIGELPSVTIVGARRASAPGLRVARSLAHDLARAGVVVVSGMALGIDTAAHEGALAGGGRSIAVLAGGPEIAYPARNRELHRRLIASGAAIAEHPPGSRPSRHHFRERNRIMAALGEVTVIVEAAQPSGSLITADLALGLGRTVGAVPGQVGLRVAAGVNDLIKDGAHLIRDARDVLDLVFGVGEVDGRRARRSPAPRHGPPLEPDLSEMLERMRAGAATVDGIAAAAGIEPRRVAGGLARLELLGYARADRLGAYSATDLRTPE